MLLFYIYFYIRPKKGGLIKMYTIYTLQHPKVFFAKLTHTVVSNCCKSSERSGN